MLALTSRVDDDNPLRMRIGPVHADSSADIVAVGEGSLATAGYYFVRASLLREADAVRRAGLPALRAFLHHVAGRGYTLRGICMPDSIDVDRPSDIEAILPAETCARLGEVKRRWDPEGMIRANHNLALTPA